MIKSSQPLPQNIDTDMDEKFDFLEHMKSNKMSVEDENIFLRKLMKQNMEKAK